MTLKKFWFITFGAIGLSISGIFVIFYGMLFQSNPLNILVLSSFVVIFLTLGWVLISFMAIFRSHSPFEKAEFDMIRERMSQPLK